MKANIHPEYHDIKVIMTDGTEYTVGSTYGKPGAELRLQVDPKNHPAYTGQRRSLDTGGRAEKFNQRFKK